MGYYKNGPTVAFEARIEFKSVKSFLVSMTLDRGLYFVPFSQIVGDMGEPDIDGNRVFEVTEWWWGVKEPIDE